MHDIFYSKETLDVKTGDIVEVDYRDRKNKKDPLLLRLIANAKVEGSPNTTTATQAHDGTQEPITIVTNGAGFSGDNGNCGGIAYDIVPCKQGTINGSSAKLHPTAFDNFQKLVDDAKKSGVDLRPGSTYRDSNQQYRLRKKYCSGYANEEELKYGNITCKPAVGPLPKPGSKNGSRHIYGEAIDIKLANGGTLAFPKSTAEALASSDVSEQVKKAILWLLENSKNYGLYNYANEAWHYSTDGR
jgi:D-alanyl-D-alanine dipeptidase